MVPWSAVDDARRLAWRVESGWTSSTLLRTIYAFDTAPEHGHASFRRGG